MPVTAGSLRDSLRQLPSLPPLQLSDRAQAALARAVALAMAPASPGDAVSDRALAAFAERQPDPTDLAALATKEARARAIAARGVAPDTGAGVRLMADRPAPARAGADWGRRAPASLRRTADPPEPAPSPLPPYAAAGAGVLAGMAAAGRLMRRCHLGGPDAPGALDRLAATIAAFNEWAADATLIDPEAGGALTRWAGVVRQARFVQQRLGVDPLDVEQLPALGEALDARARWLAARPSWSGREAAATNLLRWSPLVDCGEAWERPLRGDGALRDLGRVIRRTAATELPALREPARAAQMLAALDAAAVLQEALGDNPGGLAARSHLLASTRALERLPVPQTADPVGALDRSCLDRVRGIDRAQAGELGLNGIGDRAIPLVASGLPVLATLEAASLVRLRGPWRVDAWQNTRSS